MTTLTTFETLQTLPGGFRFPARMTVLPFEDGKLALVSPIPIDDALARSLATLGEVRFLVAPNLLHHLYLGPASTRYPDAMVLAPRGLRAKRPDLRIDADLEDGLPPELAARVDALMLEGQPSVDEYVFFHRATRTLVVTDLVFNVREPNGWVANLVLYLVGCRGRLAQSRMFRALVKDRVAAAASAERFLALPIETLVMAHGEVVRTDARSALARALEPMRRTTAERIPAG